MSVNSEYLINLALELRDAGRAIEIIPRLLDAIVAMPGNFRLWQTLAGMYRAEGDSAAAIDAYKKASALAPQQVIALHGLAQASLEAGRPSSELFERAISLASDNGMLYLGKAAALVAEGEWPTAIKLLSEMLRANPLWIDGHNALVNIKGQFGLSHEAYQSYHEAITNISHEPSLWRSYVQQLIHHEHYERALKIIATARRKIGTKENFLLEEAICASEIGDFKFADVLFDSIRNSANVFVAERHARHLIRTGRAERAVSRLIPFNDGPDENVVVPYLSVAWRILGDIRGNWLDQPDHLIRVIDLEIETLLPSLTKLLHTLHSALEAPLGQSVRGGTQTDGPLLAHEAPEIKMLREHINKAVDRYVYDLGMADAEHPTFRHIGKRRAFSGSWSVRLRGAGFHTNHVHPRGWISSALYISVPVEDEMGPKPAGWLSLGEPPIDLNCDLSSYRQIQPKPGRLVLFPSTMWHGTHSFASGERLTVAFDLKTFG